MKAVDLRANFHIFPYHGYNELKLPQRVKALLWNSLIIEIKRQIFIMREWDIGIL